MATIRLKIFFASVLRVPPRTPMSNVEGAAVHVKHNACAKGFLGGMVGGGAEPLSQPNTLKS